MIDEQKQLDFEHWLDKQTDASAQLSKLLYALSRYVTHQANVEYSNVDTDVISTKIISRHLYKIAYGEGQYHVKTPNGYQKFETATDAIAYLMDNFLADPHA
jgi:hypothetical protein